MIATVLMAIWRIIGWRGLVVASIIAIGAWWHLQAVTDAYRRGQTQERIAWQETQRREAIKREQERKVAQATINQAEADLLNANQQAAMRRRAMENALEAERASGRDLSACRLPDGVRNALD